MQSTRKPVEQQNPDRGSMALAVFGFTVTLLIGLVFVVMVLAKCIFGK